MKIGDRKVGTVTQPILSSLAAFAEAAVRPRTLFARAIVTVLVIKLFAIGGMMLFQHYADRSALADAVGVADRLGPSSLP